MGENNSNKIEELNAYINEITILKRNYSIDKEGNVITTPMLIHAHGDWKSKQNSVEELILRNEEIDKIIDKIYYILDQYKKIYENYENQINELIESYSKLFSN